MVNRRPDLSRQFAAYVVSAEDNLRNKIIILEVLKSKENYIKLSNNALNIDLEPIENSDNLITSGGVAAALKNIDIEPTEIPEILDPDLALETGEYFYITDTGFRRRLIVTTTELNTDELTGIAVT
jgi:hypothetical protein